MASVIRADALQNVNTTNLISQTNTTTITIGASGQTVAVASGASLNGFGLTWQAKSASFNAAVNYAYFVNTSTAAVTATLPASATQGDEIRFLDVAGTFSTNNLTVSRNGNNIQGSASDLTVATSRAGFAIVYYDATQGWLIKDK